MFDTVYGKPWSCRNCGAIYSTKEEAEHCTRCGGGSKTCPDCNGTKIKVNWGAPNEKCPTCGGTGKVSY